MIKFPTFNPSLYLFRQERDPEKRDKAYYYQSVQAFYSEYLKGVSLIGYSGLSWIELLRSFSEGRQPNSGIQPTTKGATETKQSAILDQNGNAIEYSQDAFNDIDWTAGVWDVLSPANKIMVALEGTLSKIEYEINADPLDYTTTHETEDNKLDRWAYKQNQEKIQAAAKLAGITYPEPDYIPESPEELDHNTERFLPAHVRYVEQVIKHTFDITHWSSDTYKLVLRDLFVLNKACVKNEYDPEDGKVKPVYINPNAGDIQRSQWMDCRDSERGWHFYLMSISQLRQYFPDKEEIWFETMAGSYAGMFDNPAKNLLGTYAMQDPLGGWGYDAFKVCIGSFEWIDINTTKEVTSTEHGRKVVKEVPLSTEVAVDKVVRFKDERMRFQCKWVVGSDDIFEYGPAYDVTYPTKNDTELTYKWVRIPGKSIIEQLVPIFKDFDDLWKKYKSLLRNSQGKIQFIDVDMLASTQGQGDDPQEAAKKSFRRFLSTNKLLFRRVNAAGMPNQNHPIAEMDGGMGSLFTEIQSAFQLNINMVEYITGLNPLSLGQSADPNAPVTTSQMAMNATANTLLPMVQAGMRLKQAVSENLVRWICVLVRGNKYSRDAYSEVIGDFGVQSLIVANKGEADYGISLTPRPNELEKQWLLENLKMATTPQQGGEREITTADGNLILNMISSGETMKTIQFYFEQARKKQAKLVEAKKKALMEQQSQLNQQDAQMAGEKAKEISKQEHDQKMEQINAASEGGIAKTVTQEGMRKQKDESVQDKKNQGALQKEALTTPPNTSPPTAT